MLGSTPYMNNWNPDGEGGRGGLKMEWSEGHVWYAEVPCSKIQGSDSQFEFKFVLKTNDNGYLRIIRWEGGNQNHKYDDTHVK
jgi:hypothetical protein